MKAKSFLLLVQLLAPASARAQAWSPEAGNGKYRNPIIFEDFSDPDVIRVGDDFYMTASSFDQVPGLPILHSSDLVHWTIVNHALPQLPDTVFARTQHGNGVWAPSLRYHHGAFWIYYGDPDRGIYLVKTRDIRGRWDPPILVKAAKGWIDPAPLWDDDGQAWLVHAFARSRSGIKHRLDVVRMSPDGTRLLDEGTRVFEDSLRHPTLEGPKLYKRSGWYYIFAPAGGVTPGWQVVLRSRHVLGPYQDRVVLAQGRTPINGPHQGGYVETPAGAGWFVHFQDRGPYGRVVLLEPVAWQADWPVIGRDPDGDGTGEPVLEWPLPRVRRPSAPVVPQTTDDFDRPRLGIQWQWSGNPRAAWLSLSARPGWLRLRAEPLPDSAANLWAIPSLLLQKLPGPRFQAETRVSLSPRAEGEQAGLVVMGLDYAYLALRRTASGVQLVQARTPRADEGTPEEVLERVELPSGAAVLRVTVTGQALCRFWYSLDGRRFRPAGAPFQARAGKWIGAKVGLFATRPAGSAAGGYADFDDFRVFPLAVRAPEAAP